MGGCSLPPRLNRLVRRHLRVMSASGSSCHQCFVAASSAASPAGLSSSPFGVAAAFAVRVGLNGGGSCIRWLEQRDLAALLERNPRRAQERQGMGTSGERDHFCKLSQSVRWTIHPPIAGPRGGRNRFSRLVVIVVWDVGRCPSRRGRKKDSAIVWCL